MGIRNFRDLEVWQLGQQLALKIYRNTSEFPARENYGLTAQLRRAAVSVPCNVSEGFNRNSRKDFRRFLYYALGSCAELETQTELAHDLGYLDERMAAELLQLLGQESRMLRKLIERL